MLILLNWGLSSLESLVSIMVDEHLWKSAPKWARILSQCSYYTKLDHLRSSSLFPIFSVCLLWAFGGIPYIVSLTLPLWSPLGPDPKPTEITRCLSTHFNGLCIRPSLTSLSCLHGNFTQQQGRENLFLKGSCKTTKNSKTPGLMQHLTLFSTRLFLNLHSSKLTV